MSDRQSDDIVAAIEEATQAINNVAQAIREVSEAIGGIDTNPGDAVPVSIDHLGKTLHEIFLEIAGNSK